MHHHLICRDCGAVQEIKDDWLQSIEERVEREFGFVVSDHRLDFTGVFNKCTKTNKSECRKKRKAV
jgi:Fur family ferric uptake transcriptional regulator